MSDSSPNGLKRWRVSFVDLHGRLRSRDGIGEPPEAPVGFCAMALGESPRGIPLPRSAPAGERYPDLHAAPDPRTAIALPGEPDVTWLLADTDDPRCPRSLLRAAIERISAHGWRVAVGTEVEAHLYRRAADGRRVPVGPTHDVAYLGDGDDLDGALRAITAAAHTAGLEPHGSGRECGRGQIEVHLGPAAPLDAADRIVRLREVIRRVGASRNVETSFLALPADGAEPSGLHLHLSLADAPRSWRAGAIAGVLDHASALTALGAPTVNGYRRLAAGGLVPTAPTWGEDDRTALVRALPDRIEVRVGDALANPHLLLAGILLAVADGIARDADPGPAGDASGRPPLPTTLEAAVCALEADALLTAGLGADLVTTFAVVKRDEARRSAGHVTSWEREEYEALL